MSTKWIIFDAMGVVFEVGQTITELLIPLLLEKNEKISLEKVKEQYYKAKLGAISSYEFWKNLGFDNEYPEIEKDYLDMIRIDPDFINAATTFNEKFSMAMLSNDIREWSSYVRSKFNVDRFFKDVIISGEVNYAKPDKRIFEVLLKRIKSKPEDCIFVDDKLTNLRTAAELGFKSIRFVREINKIPFCSEFEVQSFKELINVANKFYS